MGHTLGVLDCLLSKNRNSDSLGIGTVIPYTFFSSQQIRWNERTFCILGVAGLEGSRVSPSSFVQTTYLPPNDD